MPNNPQYIRTDKAIKQALIKLLKTKSFEKITVQDILDETPVTRSTFYKHYHDKYEIAEKMLIDFFETQETLQKAFHDSHTPVSPAIIRISQQNYEIMEALLKIRTEHVDLRNSLAKQAIEHYLSGPTGSNPELEAEIFAQAVTAFRISTEGNEDFTFDLMHDTFISVFLRLLDISEDDELRTLLKKRANTKTNLPPKKLF